MFERYTERARQVVILAQDEARGLRHNYIGTEHLLLGLLREDEGIASRVLESLDVTTDEVRERVKGIVGEGGEIITGQLPFTPRAKKVLELALREALSLGNNYIATEHLLLGLVREAEGVAARILIDLGAELDNIRVAVIRALSKRTDPVSQVESTHEKFVKALLGTRGPEVIKERAAELLASEHKGLLKADAKHKRRIHRLERVLVDHVDKNGRLKHELRRLEDALVEVYKHPEHAATIISRTIPKRIYKENLDPGKKKPKERPKGKKSA